MASIYPPIQAFMTATLKVSPIHTIYYEQSGNPNGFPIIYVHGGPGGGISENDRRYFDPNFFRVILFDQRGAGKSTPHACLEDNTTWALVSDMEKIREELKINSWAVFGGSWGSTLSLVYAETHPTRVTNLVLRGIFMLRREELLWFYQQGASFIFPDMWEPYLAAIPENERGDMMAAYYKRLTGSNEGEKLKCAGTWSTWEMATARHDIDPDYIKKAGDPKFALAFARIECHYFVNRGFFEEDDYILKRVDKIRHIPTTIVQGRYDMVCPMKSAWDLHRAFPESDLQIVSDAGHSAKEIGIQTRLVAACNKIRDANLVALSNNPAKNSSTMAAGVSQDKLKYPSLRFHSDDFKAKASEVVVSNDVAGISQNNVKYPSVRYHSESQSSPRRPGTPAGTSSPAREDTILGLARRTPLAPPGGISSNIFG